MLVIAIIALFVLIAAANPEEAKYTNSSIARLSYLEGNTYIQRAADLAYEEGTMNTPIAEGDRLGTTEGRAEVYFGRNYVRLDTNTKVDFLNLPKKGSNLTRLQIWAGNVYLNVRFLEKEKNIEIHTSDASVYVLDKGLYRFDTKEGGETDVFVFSGLVETAGEEGSILVKSEQKLEISGGRFTSRPSSFYAVAEDNFDKWNEDRDSQLKSAMAKGYLPEELEDFESELDQYGDWVYLRPYGYVWVPGGLDSEWRPYYYGRWVWLPLSGWTWLPYEPWGWSTFHYGRWGWGVGLGWYWIPTTIWGPAWVNWWWDYDYFGWAPLSYWGYPVVIINNHFYDHYHGDYPYNSRALTVIHKDQLKAKNIAQVALGQESMKELGKLNLTEQRLTLRPAASRIAVESLEGKRLFLRKEEGASRFGPELKNSLGRKIEENPPLSLNLPEERRIRKTDSFGYPSSPEISLKKYSGDKESLRPSSFLDRIYRYVSGRSSSSRSSGSKGTITSRSGSRSSSSGRSWGSSSSPSGSHPSGSIKKKN